MLIFFAVYLLIFLLTVFDLYCINYNAKGLRRVFVVICGFTLLLFAGLRWETGTDWENYYYYFGYVETLNWGHALFEVGFEMLARMMNFLSGGEYTAMLLATAFIIIICTYRSILRYSPLPILSIFLLLSYSINSSGFGYRQDIAIAILFFSLKSIVDGKFIKFCLYVYVATLFHQTAFIFLPAYIIYRIKWNPVKIMFLLVGVAGTFLVIGQLNSIAYSLGGRAGEKLAFYLGEGFEAKSSTLANPYVTFVRALVSRGFMLTLVIPLVSYKKEDKLYNGIFNLYLTGMLMYSVLASISIVFGRFSRYYDILQILILPMAIKKYHGIYRYVAALILIIYSIFKFSSIVVSAEGTYIPYKFVFDAS